MKKQILFILSLMLSYGAHAQYSENLIVEELLSTDMNSIGQKIEYPTVDDALVSIRKITFPPGATTGWHKHEIPVLSYVISGTLTVEFEDRDPTEYATGQSFSESFQTYHQGVNKTSEDLVVLAVYLSGDKKPLSIRKPDI